MSKHYRCAAAEQIEREMEADLATYARVWDRVYDVLFFGHKDTEPPPDDDEPWLGETR